ncbi:hypothetical protein PHET_09468 [Paragonimus heterotremus]|uniref:Uncharacterized protein n=1 Tax=Paragonimus heterotremus TaxID=100268 RepID=A0A8J4T305_9TREM|nr:hypothetical protein PHET_09468 [Paragonimus heterotremus]
MMMMQRAFSCHLGYCPNNRLFGHFTTCFGTRS